MKKLLVIILFFSISQFKLGKAKSTSEPERPNILWISVEDIGPFLSSYEAEGISTPNIDRLADEGILYKHAYATVGVCAPSRSSIITGMYPVSIGSHNMRTGPHVTYRSPEDEDYLQSYQGLYDQKGRNVPQYATVPPPYVRVFTEYLRKEGYYTTNNSKTDYQFNAPLTAWDDSSEQAHYKNRPEGVPFFAVFNDMVTHESRVWLKKDDPMLVDPNEVPIPAYYPVIPSVVEAVSRVWSNVKELDRNVGMILDELEAHGVLDETVIFFWSDHGGPLLRQKRAVGNSGLHVPLIVRLPNTEMAGSKIEDIVSLMDLGPTVLSLAGIKPPSYMQGRAFLGPYKSSDPHQYAFGSADRFDEVYDMSRSVIDGRYVYIRNFRPELPLIYRLEYREQIEMTSELIELNRLNKLEGDAKYIFMESKPIEELYDLHNDPWEVNNLAESKKHQDKLLELRTALMNWQLEVGDMGFIPEHDLVQMMWPGLIQPTTNPVLFNLSGNKLELKSTTKGASIAYQIKGKDDSDHWRIYHEPIEVSKDSIIKARAIRIGYKTSDLTVFEY